MRSLFHVVVIGGGFSGIALTAQLVRLADPSLVVTLIDAGRRLGRGLAYSTVNEAHLLNTRAENMSLFTDDPQHFLRWLHHSGLESAPNDFISREVYGSYIEDSFMETLAASRRGGTKVVSLVETRAVDIKQQSQGFKVILSDGCSLPCERVVLATGHAPPADLLRQWLPIGRKRYINDPWQTSSMNAIESTDRVLLLGTGLTMVDVALALSKDNSRVIQAVSRRGLLPQAHAPRTEQLPGPLKNDLLQSVSGGNLLEISRCVRRCVRTAMQRGISWRAVIDALRPLTQGLWQRLGPEDRRRFVKLLRPYWDTHRHRMAPAVAETISKLQASSRLQVRAARIRNVTDAGDSITIEFRTARSAETRRETYDWIVNCTGSDFSSSDGRTLESRLLKRGMLLSDPLGLGYMTDVNGAIIGDRGVVPGLYLLGTARRASDWEATAVPELREQSNKLAAELLQCEDRWKADAMEGVLHFLRNIRTSLQFHPR